MHGWWLEAPLSLLELPWAVTQGRVEGFSGKFSEEHLSPFALINRYFK